MLEEQASLDPVDLPSDDDAWCHEAYDLEVLGQLLRVPDSPVFLLQPPPFGSLVVGLDLGR